MNSNYPSYCNDWRYRLVDWVDNALHKITRRNCREFPIICNLERAMYSRRVSRALWDE